MPVKFALEPCWKCLQEVLRKAVAVRGISKLPTDSKRTAKRSNQCSSTGRIGLQEWPQLRVHQGLSSGDCAYPRNHSSK
jgi:hypothetical protein